MSKFQASNPQIALLAFLLLTLVDFIPFKEDMIPERWYDDYHELNASSLVEAAVICVFLYRVPENQLV
jgi:hypothetical protein